MGKKLDHFLQQNGLDVHDDMWDDEDLAHDNGVDRIVWVVKGNEDWELWKVDGEWSIEGHGTTGFAPMVIRMNDE
jgi:hypothetical protein